MNWSNVKLILFREVRDQLRDRRTVFMIAVLPMLLYPLLGMSFFQVAQFLREQPLKVLVVGLPRFDGLPPLVEKNHFARNLFSEPDRADLLQLQFGHRPEETPDSEHVADEVRRDIQDGRYEVVVYFPSDFGKRLESFRAELMAHRLRGTPAPAPRVPDPVVYHNSAREPSQIAYSRVTEVLNRWTEEVGRRTLEDNQIPAAAAKPFDLQNNDLAEVGHRKAVLWAKILPFVLLIWALTGAFYPAIDLCAGEKERGTLETLLSSPAERMEIVSGKLLTVMLFSMTTAVLNLLSMGITGSVVLSQMPNLGPPPLVDIVLLLVALPPVAALFSALCLALAAFARSTKEGQYYLMPLVLITMPLTILPMAPGVELNLGNSLIPVTGVVLLLRTALEGNYVQALPYLPIVTGVTLLCCMFAIRWATDQFNTESVLFREGERFGMGLWLKHLLRDREDTPTVPMAVFCGVLILMIKFFMGFALPAPHSFHELANLAAVTQLVVIATPALLMTIMLTRSPIKTLLLRRPPMLATAAAIALALAIHPLMMLLQTAVSHLYPINSDLAKELGELVGQADSPLVLVLVLGVVPAICEELAFRGFVLSGLRHMGHKWRAIVLSSIFFAAAHAIFQQSLVAFLAGLLLGFLAVQTGSLLPCILFHVVHNSLTILESLITAATFEEHPALQWILKRNTLGDMEDTVRYPWPVVVLGTVAAAALLYWFHKLPYARSAEESLQEAIEHQSAHSLAG